MPSTLPLTIADSDFTVSGVTATPLAKIATRLAEAVVNTAWAEAQTIRASLSSKIDAVTNDATGYLGTVGTPHVTAGTVSTPSLTAPSVSIPGSVDTTSILSTFNTEQSAQFNQLVTAFSTFRSTYFPDESNAYVAAENWLQDAIADPSGLPPTVRAAIFGDDEARILSDKVRAQDAVLAQFAGRRFPLPPDVAASAVIQIEQKAQDALAESSRKVATMSVDLHKFSVEKLLGLRDMAMTAAVKYISALVAGPEVASKVVGVGYDAQSKLISAAGDFYRAEIQAAELINKAQMFNVTNDLEAKVKNQAADLSMVDKKLEALLTEVKSLAQQSTAMLNNLHANAGMSVNI